MCSNITLHIKTILIKSFYITKIVISLIAPQQFLLCIIIAYYYYYGIFIIISIFYSHYVYKAIQIKSFLLGHSCYVFLDLKRSIASSCKGEMNVQKN